MRVEFAFDEKALRENNISLEKVVSNLKANFSTYNLPCVSDGVVLAFEDTGDKNDYARIWNLIIGYLKTDWFLKYAIKCNFYEYDDNEYFEDVLYEMTDPSTKQLVEELKR